MDTQYDLVVCGGTFDFLHAGHKAFLQFILSRSKKVVLGLTSDRYIAERKPNEGIESFAIRKKNLEAYLTAQQAFGRVEIAPIDSVYIPDIWKDYPIAAIIVTDDSRRGAELINEKRLADGLKSLPVVVHPLLKAEDDKPIAASRIRSGEINREGRLLLRPDWFSQTLYLPSDQRDQFKKPIGEIVDDRSVFASSLAGAKIVTVGDVTTKLFNEKQALQRMSVIDFVVEREKKYTDPHELGFEGSENILNVVNPAGQLTPDLFRAVDSLCSHLPEKRTIIVVEGEEDLSVLPLILRLPLAFTVFYGQPGIGLVQVVVTEEKKAEVASLMHRLSTTS